MNEFSQLVTPDGLQIKSYNHARAAKVLWKITRGLAFLETEGAMIIPPRRPMKVDSTSKEEIQLDSRGLVDGDADAERDRQPLGELQLQ